MRDLTKGSVTKHLLYMSGFLLIGLAVQTLYLLVDLYWVGSLGKNAIAAVAVAGNMTIIVLALTQMLAVGTTTVISQAVGRGAQREAETTFNQSFVLSLSLAVAFGVCGFVFRRWYCDSLSAAASTARLARDYLFWYIPALLLQFPLSSFLSALRATGAVKPAVRFQLLSIVVNIVLAPLLIFGVGIFPRLEVRGAALATLISVCTACTMTAFYFKNRYDYMRIRLSMMHPQLATWGRTLRIGVPAGAELLLTFIYFTTVYTLIRGFGPAAQAGFGAGARIVQACLLPVAALSFAVAPVVGQNFGGKLGERVRHSVYSATAIASIIMLILALVARLTPGALIRPFSNDPQVVAFGSGYVRIASLLFVAAGIVFITSSVFQAIGNAWPALLSSTTRLASFVLPAMFLSRTSNFRIEYLWYLQVASVVFQAGFNGLLLSRELRKKLTFETSAALLPMGNSSEKEGPESR